MRPARYQIEAITWAVGLSAIYLAFGLVGWNRALIPDEIRPLLIAEGSTAEALEYARLDLVHTPLSYLLQQGWLKVFGHTDTVAKAFAIVIGLATMAWFPVVARRFTAQWRIASALLCLLYLRIGSAPNLVRMYGLAILLSIGTIYFWDRWRESPTRGRLALLAVTLAALYNVHLSGLLLLPGLLAATWLYGPKNRRARMHLALAVVVSALSLIPWTTYVYPVFAERGIEQNVSGVPGYPTSMLARMPYFFLIAMDPGGGSPEFALLDQDQTRSLWWMVLVPHLMLAWFSRELLAKVFRRSGSLGRTVESTGTMLAVFVAPPSVLFLFSVFVTHVFRPRYLLVIFPFYCLLLTILAFAGAKRGKATLALGVVPLMALGTGLAAINHVKRPQLTLGTEMVARSLSANDLILSEQNMPLGYQVLWDWTRRLGRTERVNAFARFSGPGPERLRRYFPEIAAHDRDFEGIERIWYFHRAENEEWADRYFEKNGYEKEREPVVDWYHLAVYRRRAQPSDSVASSGAQPGS